MITGQLPPSEMSKPAPAADPVTEDDMETVRRNAMTAIEQTLALVEQAEMAAQPGDLRKAFLSARKLADEALKAAG